VERKAESEVVSNQTILLKEIENLELEAVPTLEAFYPK
jgi:hypothetical protein